MELRQALAEDILAVIPPEGLCKPAYQIVEEVAPLRDKEVRAVIRDLKCQGLLDVVPAGNIHVELYRRKPLRRFRLKGS